MPTSGGFWAWDFEEDGRELKIRVDGRLIRVLEDFSPFWDGYHLYCPSRRQSSPAFVALVEALRHRS